MVDMTFGMANCHLNKDRVFNNESKVTWPESKAKHENWGLGKRYNNNLATFFCSRAEVIEAAQC